MTELNVYTWYGNRELNYCPAHFVVVDTIITTESKQWILENLTGRFCLVEVPNYSTVEYNEGTLWCIGYYPAFEIPQEATYFQLIWS